VLVADPVCPSASVARSEKVWGPAVEVLTAAPIASDPTQFAVVRLRMPSVPAVQA
jgi:hypothetical protein